MCHIAISISVDAARQGVRGVVVIIINNLFTLCHYCHIKKKKDLVRY